MLIAMPPSLGDHIDVNLLSLINFEIVQEQPSKCISETVITVDFAMPMASWFRGHLIELASPITIINLNMMSCYS
jgi:hypothetical protein